MNETEEIKLYKQFDNIRNVMGMIKNLSFRINSTEKRYMAPEALRPDEMKQLIIVYRTFGDEILKLAEEWQKMVEKIDNTQDTPKAV